MANKTPEVAIYDLPGGSKVSVHKPFGSEIYSAIVELDGRYPTEGKITRDIGRAEYIYVIEGDMKVCINEETIEMQAGDSAMIEDRDLYWIEGKAKCMVIVKDNEGGASVEEDM